jgi:hypothetical protein
MFAHDIGRVHKVNSCSTFRMLLLAVVSKKVAKIVHWREQLSIKIEAEVQYGKPFDNSHSFFTRTSMQSLSVQ